MKESQNQEETANKILAEAFDTVKKRIKKAV